MIYVLATLYVLWILYLAVMNLKRAYDARTISKVALWLGYPVLLIGLALDALVNIFIMTVVFVELPREWLVTTRLKRHIKGDKSWRKSFSYFICHTLLNAFDPSGDHCD